MAQKWYDEVGDATAPVPPPVQAPAPQQQPWWMYNSAPPPQQWYEQPQQPPPPPPSPVYYGDAGGGGGKGLQSLLPQAPQPQPWSGGGTYRPAPVSPEQAVWNQQQNFWQKQVETQVKAQTQPQAGGNMFGPPAPPGNKPYQFPTNPAQPDYMTNIMLAAKHFQAQVVYGNMANVIRRKQATAKSSYGVVRNWEDSYDQYNQPNRPYAIVQPPPTVQPPSGGGGYVAPAPGGYGGGGGGGYSPQQASVRFYLNPLLWRI